MIKYEISANPRHYRSVVQVHWLEMAICEAIHVRFNQQNDYAPVLFFSCFVHTLILKYNVIPTLVEWNLNTMNPYEIISNNSVS